MSVIDRIYQVNDSKRGRTVLALVALAAVWIAVLTPQLAVVWGVLFVVWAIKAMIDGSAFLIGWHDREDEPLLFWLVSLSWLAMGIIFVIAPNGPGA